MRAFVASIPPPALKRALAELQATLRALPGGDRLRWTPPDQIHLTLRFLGEITPEQSSLAIEALRRACSPSYSFSLKLGGLGFFPNARRPRVFWVGLEGQIRELLALQTAIARALAPLVDTSEDEFHPHLTLGRVRHTGGRLDLTGIQWTAPAVAFAWQVDSVHLMKSERNHAGAVHSPLFSLSLSPPPPSQGRD